MSINLIGITGKAGSGKDTAADHIVDKYGYRKHNLADPIKKALNAMFGWDMSYWEDRVWKESPLPKIGKSPRFLAQALGTEWGREIVNEQIWLHIAEDLVDSVACANYYYQGVVMPDFRFYNEALWLVGLQNNSFSVSKSKMIHIERPYTDYVDNTKHSSEAGISNTFIDSFINNNGSIDDLKFDVEMLMENSNL